MASHAHHPRRVRELVAAHAENPRMVNLSIKIPPPVGESRFPVLDASRRVATSLSRRVLLSGGVDAAGSCLKERRRRVSLNVLAVFLLFGGLA